MTHESSSKVVPATLFKSYEGAEKVSFFEHWLMAPKLLYFLLNLFVYACHSIIAIIITVKWKFPYYLYGYTTILMVSNFFGSMFWSSLAEKTGRYKTILVVSAVLYTIFAIALCVPITSKTIILILGKEYVKYNLEYCYIFFLMLGFNFFLAASFPLLDSLVMGMMAVNPRVSKEQFGNQRMFGSIGHLAGTLISFAVFDKRKVWGQILFQLAVTFTYLAAIILLIPDVKPLAHGHGHGGRQKAVEEGVDPKVPTLLESMPTSSTPVPPSAAHELAAEGTVGVRHPALTLLKDANFMFFMLFILTLGIARAVTTNFQKVLVMNDKSMGLTKIAMIDIPRTMSEVFVYWYAKRLHKLMGGYWILVLSQFAGVIRIVGYGLLDLNSSNTFGLSCVFEILKGFSSGMISSAAIPIASELAPAGCETTAQGIYSGVFTGISMAAGGVLGAVLLHMRHDPTVSGWKSLQAGHVQSLFITTAALCTVVTLLIMVKYIFFDRVMAFPGVRRRPSVH